MSTANLGVHHQQKCREATALRRPDGGIAYQLHKPATCLLNGAVIDDFPRWGALSDKYRRAGQARNLTKPENANINQNGE